MEAKRYEMGPRGLVPIDVAANSIKNNLAPGAVLHWGGNMAWPAQNYAVIKRLQAGFEARTEVYYEMVSLSTFAAQRVEALHIKAENDPKVWHGQHFFLTDITLDADEILDLIERARVKVLADEATKDAGANKFAADVARLRAAPEWAHLAQAGPDVYAGVALASKNIKRELSKLWPAVAFSVRSKSYSGGNSIDVHWTDGPTTKEVERRVTGKYSGGDFDGMTDSYTYSSSAWTEVFGSGKYIHESRSFTVRNVALALLDLADAFGISRADAQPETPTPENGGCRPRYGWTLAEAVRHCLYQIDLTAGYKTPAGGILSTEGI